MRAMILRRMLLLEARVGGPMIVGASASGEVLRLQTFLARNTHPWRTLDAATDPEARAHVEWLQAGPRDLPLVLCPNGQVLRNPTIDQLARCIGLVATIDRQKVYDVAIVGAGPAGLATAVAPSFLRDSESFVVGATAAQLVGGLVTQMSPFMIGGLTSGLSLSERDAGFVVSVEILALAMTAIAIAPVPPRFSDRRTGLASVTLTLLASGASIFIAWLPMLTVLRGIAGIGEGAIYAVSLSVVASRSHNPDRAYGYFQVAWALSSVVLFAVGGQLTAAFAQRGIFALMTGVTLALAPLLLLLPDDCAKSSERVAGEAAPASPTLCVMALAAIMIYLVASSAIYVFSTALGERAGLDTSAVGYVLSISTLVGFAGAGAATALNVRWGRMLPISSASRLSCLCSVSGAIRSPTSSP
jgi:MFS family permease